MHLLSESRYLVGSSGPADIDLTSATNQHEIGGFKGRGELCTWLGPGRIADNETDADILIPSSWTITILSIFFFFLTRVESFARWKSFC